MTTRATHPHTSPFAADQTAREFWLGTLRDVAAFVAMILFVTAFCMLVAGMAG